MMLNIFLAKQETSRYLVFIDSYFPNRRLAWVSPMCVTLTIFFNQLDNSLRFRLCRIKEIEVFFIAKIRDREKMSGSLKKYNAALN